MKSIVRLTINPTVNCHVPDRRSMKPTMITATATTKAMITITTTTTPPALLHWTDQGAAVTVAYTAAAAMRAAERQVQQVKQHQRHQILDSNAVDLADTH